MSYEALFPKGIVSPTTSDDDGERRTSRFVFHHHALDRAICHFAMKLLGFTAMALLGFSSEGAHAVT